RSSASWIAAIESSSACGPQAKAHPEPPMAQAPKPIGVMSRSEFPRRRVCMDRYLKRVKKVTQESLTVPGSLSTFLLSRVKWGPARTSSGARGRIEAKGRTSGGHQQRTDTHPDGSVRSYHPGSIGQGYCRHRQANRGDRPRTDPVADPHRALHGAPEPAHRQEVARAV